MNQLFKNNKQNKKCKRERKKERERNKHSFIHSYTNLNINRFIKICERDFISFYFIVFYVVCEISLDILCFYKLAEIFHTIYIKYIYFIYDNNIGQGQYYIQNSISLFSIKKLTIQKNCVKELILK